VYSSIFNRGVDLLGLEPSELSALFFLDYCKSGGGLNNMRSDRMHGGQFLRIATGKSFEQHSPRFELTVSRNSIVLKVSRRAPYPRVSSPEFPGFQYSTNW
jgi:hypothetical protein